MSFFNKEEWKLLWPFYLEAFLGTALLVFPPFMIIYFASISFSATQIGILLAAYPLASLLFEIPTGAIADLFGRKPSVMLGWILEGILFILIPFSTNFYFIFIIMLLLGASGTLVSGAYEAWVVDLIQSNKKNLVNSYFSKKRSLYNLAFIFSGIIGAFLVSIFGLNAIWPVSGISMILSVVFLYFGYENFERQETSIKQSIKKIYQQTKISLSYSFSM